MAGKRKRSSKQEEEDVEVAPPLPDEPLPVSEQQLPLLDEPLPSMSEDSDQVSPPNKSVSIIPAEQINPEPAA
jgi:hypothetical protein